MSLTVIDLGCFPHGHEVSIERLIDRYQPDLLLGFDPYPDLVEGESVIKRKWIGSEDERTTVVRLERKAAWTMDGRVAFAVVQGERAWDSTVMRDKDSRGEWSGDTAVVPCFDLASLVLSLPSEAHVIVKMDVEGAEFPLLEHLIASNADTRIGLLLVEWHDEKMGGRYAEWRAGLPARIRCPLEEWKL